MENGYNIQRQQYKQGEKKRYKRKEENKYRGQNSIKEYPDKQAKWMLIIKKTGASIAELTIS